MKNDSKSIESDLESYKKRHSIRWDLILLFVGCIIGFSVSDIYDYFQIQNEDTNTAKAIYNELTSPNNPIDIYSNFYWGYSPFAKNEGFKASYGYPILTPDTLYPDVRFRLQRFEKNLAKNVTEYYDRLAWTEKMRVRLEEIEHEDTKHSIANRSENTPYENAMLYDKENLEYLVERNINESLIQRSIILKQLRENYKI